MTEGVKSINHSFKIMIQVYITLSVDDIALKEGGKKDSLAEGALLIQIKIVLVFAKDIFSANQSVHYCLRTINYQL